MAETNCYRCGAALPPGALRCPNCGAAAPLSDDEIKRSTTVRSAIITPPQPPTPPGNASFSANARPVETNDAESSRTEILTPLDPPQKAAPERPEPVASEPIPLRSLKVKKAPEPKKKAKNNTKKAVSSAPPGVKSVILALVIVGFLGLAIWLLAGRPGSNGGIADAPAPYYAITDTPLRSSQMNVGRGNEITNVPYGSEVTLIATDGSWSTVRYDGIEGYMPSNTIVNAADMFLLAGAFRYSNDAGIIPEAHERQAVLHYYRANGFTGEVSPEGAANGVSAPDNGVKWLFCNQRSGLYWSIYRDHIYDPDSRYPDLAFVLRAQEQPNRLVVYSFSEDGTPIFRAEREIGTNRIIQSITTDASSPDGLNVEFLL